jgi:hypothetical protein
MLYDTDYNEFVEQHLWHHSPHRRLRTLQTQMPVRSMSATPTTPLAH